MAPVIPHSFWTAEVLMLCLLEPAADVADRLGVRDSLKNAHECDHSDDSCQDGHQTAPSAAEASVNHRITFVRQKSFGATLCRHQCAVQSRKVNPGPGGRGLLCRIEEHPTKETSWTSKLSTGSISSCNRSLSS
jgi:hypothetical protein